jgi:hypothetical protein
MASPTPPIHPLDLNGVVTFSLRLLRHGWRPIYAVAIVFMLPAYILLGAVDAYAQSVVGNWLNTLEDWLREIDLRQVPLALPLDGLGTFMLATLSTAAISMVASALTYAAVVDVSGAIYRGETPSAAAAIRRTIGRIGSLAGIYSLLVFVNIGLFFVGVLAIAALALTQHPAAVFLAIVVGLVLVVGVVSLAVRWALAVQPIVLEGSTALAALDRSWRLVGGSMWRVFGYVLLFSIVIGLLVGAFSTAGGLISGVPTATPGFGAQPSAPLAAVDPLAVFGQTLVQGAGMILLTPVSVIAFTLLYFDLRWRRGEGLATSEPLVAEKQL